MDHGLGNLRSKGNLTYAKMLGAHGKSAVSHVHSHAIVRRECNFVSWVATKLISACLILMSSTTSTMERVSGLFQKKNNQAHRKIVEAGNKLMQYC